MHLLNNVKCVQESDDEIFEDSMENAQETPIHDNEGTINKWSMFVLINVKDWLMIFMNTWFLISCLKCLMHKFWDRK